MHTYLAKLLLVVAVALVVGAPRSGGAGGAKKAKPAAAAECETDSDCVLITDGCCGCNEGGKQKAVPKRDSEKLEKKRKSSCKQTMCTMVISQDASCSARAVCKERTCALGQ
jgi:hypothetical protein